MTIRQNQDANFNDNETRGQANLDDGLERVDIRIQFVDYPEHDPKECWDLSSDNGMSIDTSWLINEVRKLGHEPLGKQERQPLFDLRATRRDFCWGGDSSTLQIVIDLSVGILGAALWDSAKAIGARIAGKIRDGELIRFVNFTEGEAQARAEWAISSRYGVPFDQIQTIGVDHQGTEATVRVRDSQGTIYTCEMVIIDELVCLSRTTWSRPTEACGTAKDGSIVDDGLKH